jgi:membrane fusion protein (multidrug efflux system)
MTVRSLTPVRISSLAALTALMLLSGCGKGETQQQGGGRRGQQGPPQVGYVIIQTTSVPITTELAGRTTAYQSSEVRPQVSGIIHRRFFTEGALVRQGQPLYQIDPSLYRAAANQAQANLASAAATAEASRIKAERYKPLAEIEAVAKQDYTDAAAQARQAEAAVAQNRAALDTARINLRFTTVPAPITGRIGRSLFTEGALVTTNQTDPLATIQRLDPIYVDIQQSSADLLALRRALASGGQTPTNTEVRLKLEDGSEYGYAGSVEFSEVVVSETTGTVTLRARFPNPQGLLLPGMFVRATFAQSIDNNAFLIPQPAVSRDPKGIATVFVVGPGNKAIQRRVTATRAIGTNWVVTSGLNRGDKVIVQGVGRTLPNQVVRPVPASQPERIGAPQGDGRQAGQKRD